LSFFYYYDCSPFLFFESIIRTPAPTGVDVFLMTPLSCDPGPLNVLLRLPPRFLRPTTFWVPLGHMEAPFLLFSKNPHSQPIRPFSAFLATGPPWWSVAFAFLSRERPPFPATSQVYFLQPPCNSGRSICRPSDVEAGLSPLPPRFSLLWITASKHNKTCVSTSLFWFLSFSP